MEKADSKIRRFLFVAVPVILFVLAVISSLFAGAMQLGIFQGFSLSLLKGLPFALAILVIMGSHALGHYITARKYGVKAYLPLFIPKLGIAGILGAFTRMEWPIRNRNALIRIFLAGPIAGFAASILMVVLGLYYSDVIDKSYAGEASITLGESVTTYIATSTIIGKIPASKDVLLHPVAFAGWMGLFYNFWHLLPVGRLDGGRLIYALWGYRITKWVSLSTILILISLTLIWHGWLNMAIFCAVCMFRFRQQYEYDTYDDRIDKSLIAPLIAAAIILLISFVPNPFSII